MAVYRFKVKESGSTGLVNHIKGMNVEILVSGFGAPGSPFNTTVEKLFIQEFAKKYNLNQDVATTSGIRAIFKQSKLDVEEL